MKLLATNTTAPSPAKTADTTKVALFLAVLLIVMVVGQLFSFEKFIPLVRSFGFGGGHGTATLVAGLIVVSEVLALPFLLRMYLSPLFRIFSMLMGWVAIGLWLVIAIVVNITPNAISNIGFFGTKIHLANGWWAVCYMAGLALLIGWASWGMWPTIAAKVKAESDKKHAKL